MTLSVETYNFRPATCLEKFGFRVYNLLVENFPQTYFVGGMVRDFLLGRKIMDLDIATSATPKMVAETLKKHSVNFNLSHVKMGVVIVPFGIRQITITTFRKDLQAPNRYPKVKFVKSAKADAKRRDFTINSLYFSPKTQRIFDFHGGLKDLQKKKIRFLNQPQKKIHQDPLRIVRALRFAIQLNFRLETQTKRAIKQNFELVKQLTKSRIEKEITKLQNGWQKKILTSVLDNKKSLDRYF